MEGFTLEGRIAVVTGGAGGLGTRIVQDLSALGATVVVADVNETGAKEVAASADNATAAGVDLSDPASIESFAPGVLEQFGRVDNQV
jgi:NAD(P)-dependent dehydrogenase (short-subunit alcohol dehydrogenase family)